MFLLHSDSSIFFMKGHPAVSARYARQGSQTIFLSAISYYGPTMHRNVRLIRGVRIFLDWGMLWSQWVWVEPFITSRLPLSNRDRKSTRLNSSHAIPSRMPSSA